MLEVAPWKYADVVAGAVGDVNEVADGIHGDGDRSDGVWIGDDRGTQVAAIDDQKATGAGDVSKVRYELMATATAPPAAPVPLVTLLLVTASSTVKFWSELSRIKSWPLEGFMAIARRAPKTASD